MLKRKKVLLVTNSISDSELNEIKCAIAEPAHQVDVELSLVHVIPRLPMCYFNLPSIGLLLEKYYEEAKQCLSQVGLVLSIPQKNQWLVSGKTRTEVLRLAGKLQSDFVLASSEQIQELQRSLFFKNIEQLALVKNFNQLKQL